MLALLRGLVPETPLLPQDIYNQTSAFRRNIRQGHSATEALIQHLQTSGTMHHVLKDPDSNRLKGLFITCPESVQYLQSHHDVILIDNTYSTNRFNMPLMNTIG